jgi:putative ABC transport system permease protein
MFLRFVSQSIRRSPRRKAMTVAAVAMGTAVATAMLGVMLDIGDRVNRELRSLGANLMVTPKAQSLPVEIGGISYRPVSTQDYIPESQVTKIKSTFWQLNITGFSPALKASVSLGGRNVPVEAFGSGAGFAGRMVPCSKPDCAP